LFFLGGMGILAMGSSNPAGATLSSPVLVPGDSASEPAAGRQETAQISRGGDAYLVVWADNRSSLEGVGSGGPYTGRGLGTMTDIYAARVDLSGAVVDAVPRVVSEAVFNQTVPRVGWNGQNWLVAWMTERETDRYFFDVLAVRVAPDGTVLDPSPILLHAGPTTLDEYPPFAVGSDGTNWVVLWRGLDELEGIFTIEGARVAPDGTVLDPGGRTLRRDVWNSAPTSADIAFAGDEYLMTWLELDSLSADWVVRGQRLEPDLDPIGSVFKINRYVPSSPRAPAVASNGTDFLVAWSEERYYGFSQVFASRVSHAGSVLDPAGIEVTPFAGYTLFRPDVVWDGARYVVAYNIFLPDAADEDVYLTRITTGGTVLDPSGRPVSTDPGGQNEPSIGAAPGGGVQAVWTDDFQGGDIATARVEAGGTAGAKSVVSLGAPRQSFPEIAPGGTGSLLVFRSEISGESRILAERLDEAGSFLDPEPVRLAAGPALANPSAAWNGTHYLIVWEATLEGRGQIYGRRMLPDGTIVDPAPIPIMAGITPDVAALGSTFLVVGTDAPDDPHLRSTFGIRVASDGTVLAPRSKIGTNFDVRPAVAPFGARWLVVWEQNVTHNNPRSSIVGAFVDPDGVPNGVFGISDGGFDDAPDLATAAETALVVWSEHDIFGRRIQQDGTLLDTAKGILVTGAPEDQLIPAVAWDGTVWVADFADLRNGGFPSQPRGDIFAARVDAQGGALDPQGFAVADLPRPEDTPTVTAKDGSWIFAYASFQSGFPYANFRIAVRTNSPAAESPPGRSGTLRVSKNPNGTDLDLVWSASPCTNATDYGVYEGTIGAWYDHGPSRCSTGGATSATVTPAAGDRYFLVVPSNATEEGSYGTDSSGLERPPSSNACWARSDPAACS
jgi:hypothetical protein